MRISRHRPNRAARFLRLDGLGVSMGLLLAAAGGCGELINPFRDDLPAAAIITTASASRIQEAGLAPASRHRGWEAQVVAAQDLGVTHWPLWWEDVVEDSGSDDGQFAWTWRDFVYILYGPGRQIVNTVGLPLSMLVDPPGALRCSDGLISRQMFGMRNHDAVACSGAAIPPDIIEAYEQPASD